MNPGTTFERIYRELKLQLGQGLWRPGTRIEPALVAAELGASVSWTFDERLTVSLEGMNLLDEEYLQYLGREELVAQRFHTGRRFMASFRFKF